MSDYILAMQRYRAVVEFCQSWMRGCPLCPTSRSARPVPLPMNLPTPSATPVCYPHLLRLRLRPRPRLRPCPSRGESRHRLGEPVGVDAVTPPPPRVATNHSELSTSAILLPVARQCCVGAGSETRWFVGWPVGGSTRRCLVGGGVVRNAVDRWQHQVGVSGLVFRPSGDNTTDPNFVNINDLRRLVSEALALEGGQISENIYFL